MAFQNLTYKQAPAVKMNFISILSANRVSLQVIKKNAIAHG